MRNAANLSPPPPKRRPWRLWVASLPLYLALGVQASTPTPPTPIQTPTARADETGTTALRSRVQTLVGSATCSADADCRTLAMGAKACGGPEAYIAWSTRITDEAALGSAVADYNAAQQAANLREGRMSNCAFVTDPGAVCVAAAGAGSRCQLRQGSGRAGTSSR